MRKGRRKKLSPDYAPWGVQCENRKNTSATQKHIHDIATGEVNPAQQAAIWSRSHWSGAGQTRLTRPADRSEQRRMVEGGGGNVCNVCRVGEERESVSLHCTSGVFSCNSLAKATVGEPEKDKIVLSLGRVNIPIFAGYSLSVFVHFGLILINFPL